MVDQEVRMPLLQRLAEQAMSDPDFRAIARTDLDAALAAHGYDLNATEMALVHRFRDALEEAGVDLFLTPEFELDLSDSMTADRLDAILRSQGS